MHLDSTENLAAFHCVCLNPGETEVQAYLEWCTKNFQGKPRDDTLRGGNLFYLDIGIELNVFEAHDWSHHHFKATFFRASVPQINLHEQAWVRLAPHACSLFQIQCSKEDTWQLQMICSPVQACSVSGNICGIITCEVCGVHACGQGMEIHLRKHANMHWIFLLKAVPLCLPDLQ